MSRFWSALARELTPYVPGSSRASPISSSSTPTRARSVPRPARWRRSARRPPTPQALSRSGSDGIARNIGGLSRREGGSDFVGNGSDEVLAHIFAGLLKHDRPLLFPDITYSFYPVYCRFFGIAHEAIPLDGEMRVRVADYRRPAGAIILANPNAPTGIALRAPKSRRWSPRIPTFPSSSTRPMSISAARARSR